MNDFAVRRSIVKTRNKHEIKTRNAIFHLVSVQNTPVHNRPFEISVDPVQAFTGAVK